MEAYVYLLLRQVQTRKVTQEIVWSFIDHERRRIEDADRKVRQSVGQEPGGFGDDGAEAWGG